MGKALLILVLVFGTALCATVAHATDAYNVALCVGCTTPAQFNAAGKQAAGTNFTQPRTILVVNPDTTGSKWVQVTPAGQVPLSVGRKKPLAYAPQGVAITIDSDPLANVFIAGDEQTPSFKQQFGGSSAIQWPVSTDEHSEIKGVIEYNRDSYVILLPSDLFQSYMSTDPAQLSGYIYSALVQKNSGWAEQQLGKSIRGFLVSKVQNYFGKKGKVCTVWVNGDSACFAPDVSAPHADSQISGSGKDADKNPLPDRFSPTPVRLIGSGMGVYTGNQTERGYNLDYAGTWGSGVWIVCGYVGKQLISCYLQQE